MENQHPFEMFLEEFIPVAARKSAQLNKAYWLLETTGHPDAADLKAELDTELKLLYSDQGVYEMLLEWDRDKTLKDPVLKRELNILLRAFRQNQIPEEMLSEISKKEAALSQTYANFRPLLDGKPLSDNAIREILKNEEDPKRRKQAWAASKEIGDVLAPKILELVALRNKAAKSLGYPDYFQMQLDLQEVDPTWLQNTLEDLAERSNPAYEEMLQEIQEEQARRFKGSKEEMGPWAWSDPFCQEDPLDCKELDSLVEGHDLVAVCEEFYRKMGFNVDEILKKSDMFERPGKNQHAFCINIDRKKDVRTLNNVKSSIKWLETILHELGHAVYELGFDDALPWLLREPPHMIPTEAMALIAGRQAYRYESLITLLGKNPAKENLLRKADDSLRRRQLIFSRWVMVMTAFEKELYSNPKQDLNTLWWKLVQKYQMIPLPEGRPDGRKDKNDWAAKYHMGLAPVYYFSYLLGEMFASAIEESLRKMFGSNQLSSPSVGKFLNEKLFAPGDKMKWSDLAAFVTGIPLNPDAWIGQFAKEKPVSVLERS